MTGTPATLQGRRILITRARDGADKAADAFREAGAVPIVAPTIETLPLADALPMRETLRNLHADDWLVLTSPTAARLWAALVAPADLVARVAVVGGATATVLAQGGYTVSLVSPRALGEELAEAIIACGGGRRVLLPRSDKALPGLPNRLRQAGYSTIDVDLYRTVTRQWTADEAATATGVAAVTLMSPSAALGLSEQPGVGTWLATAKLVAMGPTTAVAVQQHFGRVDAVAEPPSLPGLVAATAAALAQS
jgi:uroporphyrinogen-III synthase